MGLWKQLTGTGRIRLCRSLVRKWKATIGWLRGESGKPSGGGGHIFSRWNWVCGLWDWPPITEPEVTKVGAWWQGSRGEWDLPWVPEGLGCHRTPDQLYMLARVLEEAREYAQPLDMFCGLGEVIWPCPLRCFLEGDPGAWDTKYCYGKSIPIKTEWEFGQYYW